MKMRYQHLKITKKVGQFVVPTLPVLLVIILIAGNFTVPAFVSSFVHTLAKPVWTFRDTLLDTYENSQGFFQDKKTLLEENSYLREKISELQRETYVTKTYQAENKKLLELLDRIDENSGVLSAAVVHGDPFSLYDAFIIDLGQENGLRDNMLILSPQNIAIGYVAKTLEKTSIVKRFSAPDTNITAVIQASTSIQATLTGHGGGTMKLFLPRDVSVVVDDSVILPTFSTYPIGKVAAIEVAPEDAYKTIYVRSQVNMYELRFVLVDTTSLWHSGSQTDLFELEIVSENNKDETGSVTETK
jgi:cell shape-determining protein MreC